MPLISVHTTQNLLDFISGYVAYHRRRCRVHCDRSTSSASASKLRLTDRLVVQLENQKLRPNETHSRRSS